MKTAFQLVAGRPSVQSYIASRSGHGFSSSSAWITSSRPWQGERVSLPRSWRGQIWVHSWRQP